MDLRYPIGKFEYTGPLTKSERNALIEDIDSLPANLRKAVDGLSDEQLETPYRPGGWTVRQVVHHLADSHINSHVRFRLALTEEQPTIKPYFQERWAELNDARSAPMHVSLDLLDALHRRWVILLKSLSDADFSKSFEHPESGTVTLDRNLGLYAWHGKHHVAHITALRERMGW